MHKIVLILVFFFDWRNHETESTILQKSLPRYYFLVIFVIFTAMLTAFLHLLY